MQQCKILTYRWCKCEFLQPYWRTILQYLIKLKMNIFYNPVLLLISLFPRKKFTSVQKKIYQRMLIEAFWNRKRKEIVMWYIQTIACYTEVKINILAKFIMYESHKHEWKKLHDNSLISLIYIFLMFKNFYFWGNGRLCYSRVILLKKNTQYIYIYICIFLLKILKSR